MLMVLRFHEVREQKCFKSFSIAGFQLTVFFFFFAFSSFVPFPTGKMLKIF